MAFILTMLKIWEKAEPPVRPCEKLAPVVGGIKVR